MAPTLSPVGLTDARGCRAALLLLALALTSSPASAQVAAGPMGAQDPPPALAGRTVTLADAVGSTLVHHPRVKLAEQDVTRSAGRVQETRGVFDWTLLLTPSFTYNNVGLAPDVRNNERDRRLQFQAVAVAFGIVNRELLNTIGTLPGRPPRCPLSFPSASEVASDGVDPLALKLHLPGFENTRFTLSSSFRDSLRAFRSGSPCVPDTALSPNTDLLAGMWTAIGGTGLNEAVVTLTQTPEQLLKLNQQIAEAVAARAKLAHDRLGVVPLDQVSRTSRFDGSLSKAFRNGVIGGVHMNLRGDAQNFKHKSLDIGFGGMGTPFMYHSSVFATLNVPLSRHRGGVSIAAPQRAAELTLTAERDRLRHTASEEAFRTVLAYLNLAGAQERLRALEESLARQRRIEQLTGQLVDLGDLPQVESNRTRARAAAVEASLSQTRSAVLDARLSLAEAMGITIDALADAPLAGETFSPALAALPELASLTGAALSSRFDARALVSLREAARILQAGAEADQRPLMDLELRAGMSTFEDNPFFFILPDEANPIFTQLPQQGPPVPTEGAVRFSSPVGFSRAMFERRWKPLVALNLRLDLPWGNNTQRGRMVQATASLQRAAVQERDLQRVIRENITEALGALRRKDAAIRESQTAVDRSQQTVQGVIELFEIGDQTLIDTLLAEESLTQDTLALVRLRQEYLSLLARLRFETGTLLEFTGPDLRPEQIRLEFADLVRD